jgi:hypothetical protein
MRANPLDSVDAFAVAQPVFALTLVAIAVVILRLKQLIRKPKRPQHRRRRLALSAANVAIGLSLLPLAVMYRPSLNEVAKAQIRQQEDADEDDTGDPDSPKKHLLRQLRRIRRGEQVKTLFLRLK